MILMDTNVLIYAFWREAERHEEYRAWLLAMVNSPEPYAVSDLALTGMFRIVTNRRIFKEPASTGEALAFAELIREQPQAMVVAPGPRFWSIFTELCGQTEVRGNLVPDAYLAALAIENACEFVTVDRDFARFPGLRWQHPLN
jgi:toxin-antitoxin system PIN domain toxin